MTLRAKIIEDVPKWVGEQYPELGEEALIAKEQELYQDGTLIELDAEDQTYTITVLEIESEK